MRQNITSAGQSGAMAFVGNIPSGATVKWSMKVKSSRAGTLTMYAEGNKDGAYAGFSASGGGTSTSIVANTWVTLYGQGTAPAGVLTGWRFGFYNLALQASDALWFDEVTIEVNVPTLGTHFSAYTTPANPELQQYRFLGATNNSASVYETRRILVPRASDLVTLTLLPAPSYVRAYYLMQDSTLPAPSVPTTNPPPDPWSINEPVYQLGQDKTVYSVMLTAYGSIAFEYGPVQLSTSYKAAKDAYLAAQGAIVTANGKNRVVWSTQVPSSTTGFVPGDAWFVKHPSTQNIIAQYELFDFSGTYFWVPRKVDNELIANLDAGKITAGTISTDRLGANSIGTNKLLISSFTNLVQDPSFEYAPNPGWTLYPARATVETDPTNARTGSKVLMVRPNQISYVAAQQTPFQVKEGDQYRVGFWIKFNTTGYVPQVGGVFLRFRYGDSETNLTTYTQALQVIPPDLSNQYIYVGGEWEVPEGARYARLEIVSQDPTTNDGRIYYIDDVEVFKMVQGELIVDGTIQGIKIAANEITSLHIQAQAIAAQHIQANSIFADMIGANEIKGKHIAFQTIEGNMIKTGTLEVSHVSPTFGKDLIISGNVSIISAVAAANSAQSSANAVAGNVAAMQTYYTFGPTGAVISNPASVLATAIRSDRIEMLENGNVISYWNSGTLYVNQLQASRVTLASHQLEAFGTDGTVVRSLG